jgi:hypothetical protein
MMAFNGLPYADLILILVFCCSHQAVNSGAKGYLYLTHPLSSLTLHAAYPEFHNYLLGLCMI